MDLRTLLRTHSIGMMRAGAERPFRRAVLSVLLILLVMLIGYHGLVVGAHFFNQEDSNTLYDYAHGTALGNG